MKARNTKIELLRFLLITGICFWHVVIHGLHFREGVCPPLWGTILSCLCSPCVYCFMFISGYYGIHLRIKKTANLLFIAFFCLLVGSFFRYILFGEFLIGDFAKHLLPISTNKWWFMTNYFIIYLISPFLNNGINNVDKKTLSIIFILLTILEIGSLIKMSPNSGSNLYGLLYIYFLARFLKKNEIKMNFLCSLSVFLICFIILSSLVCIILYQLDNRENIGLAILSYNNPLIILMAISLFFIFEEGRIVTVQMINTLLSPILYVYLLTESLGHSLYENEVEWILSSPYIGMALFFIVIFICLLIGHIGQFFFSIIYSYVCRCKWLHGFYLKLGAS